MTEISNIISASMQDPKSTEGIFELPCGLLDQATGNLVKDIEVREMTGEEEDMLASKNGSVVRKLAELLSRCTVRIGTITQPHLVRDALLDLTLGDRMFVLFAIRRVTLGDVYPFKAQCPACQKEEVVTVDLSTLETKAPPDPKARLIDAVLPKSKLPVRIKVLTGRDEDRISQIKGADDLLSLNMLSRIDTLNGVPATLSDIKKLKMADRNFLRELFEKNDGGIDVTVDVGCSNCQNEYKTDLNVGQVGFFFPSAARKT